jgi:nicotinamidase-related amidase
MTSALILIDVQKGLEEPWFGARNNPAMEENGLRLLAEWRARALPRVIVQHASTTPGSPLRPDQPGHALKEGYEPLPGEKHVVKGENSAFIGTDLEAWLKDHGLAHITVGGITTEHCVSTTVRMAANLGFKVDLVADACHATAKRRADGDGDIDAETVHQTELAILDGEFARIVTTHDVIQNLPAA